MSSVVNFPALSGPGFGAAEPFPGEPLDDPGVQPGDPGAEPPPANLEPVKTNEDPIVQMIEKITNQAREAMDAQVRLSAALNEQISGGAYTCLLLRNAISRLQPSDLDPRNLLMRELHREASALATLLAPMCAEQSAARH
jgi:hypothetical protein